MPTKKEKWNRCTQVIDVSVVTRGRTALGPQCRQLGEET